MLVLTCAGRNGGGYHAAVQGERENGKDAQQGDWRGTRQCKGRAGAQKQTKEQLLQQSQRSGKKLVVLNAKFLSLPKRRCLTQF